MTDAQNSSEGLIAVAVGIVTLVGAFFAWARGDKEGVQAKEAITETVVRNGMTNITTQNTFIHYCEEIIARLDRIHAAIQDEKNEELTARMTNEFRDTATELLDQIKDKIDANERSRREDVRGKGGG